jgi:hypothetical protein
VHCRRGIGGVVRAVVGGLELGVVVGGGPDTAALGLGTGGGGGGGAARALGGDVGRGEVDKVWLLEAGAVVESIGCWCVDQSS